MGTVQEDAAERWGAPPRVIIGTVKTNGEYWMTRNVRRLRRMMNYRYERAVARRSSSAPEPLVDGG